jgi:regulator of replication initiation timing
MTDLTYRQACAQIDDLKARIDNLGASKQTMADLIAQLGRENADLIAENGYLRDQVESLVVSENNLFEKQRRAAARVEAAVRAALSGAPKLTLEQTNEIVGLLLLNTETPKAAWIEEPAASSGSATESTPTTR